MCTGCHEIHCAIRPGQKQVPCGHQTSVDDNRVSTRNKRRDETLSKEFLMYGLNIAGEATGLYANSAIPGGSLTLTHVLGDPFFRIPWNVLSKAHRYTSDPRTFRADAAYLY